MAHEEAYNYHYADDTATFTLSDRSKLNAFINRCEEYNADFEVERHTIGGEFDTATIRVSTEDLRPLRYLIKT